MSIMDTLSSRNKLDFSNGSVPPESQAPGTPQSSAQVSPKTPERPATPTQSLTVNANIQAPRTPEIKITSNTMKQQTPRTPSSSSKGNSLYPPSSASSYLSSPIRRRRVHQNFLSAGTMTPGRPNLHYSIPTPSPYKVTKRVPNSPSTNGKVQLGSLKTLPNVPLQTVFLSEQQVSEINDIEQCRKMLLASLEESNKYKIAAQQFRAIASSNIFQLSLTKIEHEETQQRHEVEANIQQREIEKLIVDVMGYNDQNASTEQIRMKLKSTNNKLKELNSLLDMKDKIIAKLEQKLEHEPSQGSFSEHNSHAQLHSHNQNLQNQLHSSPVGQNRAPTGFSALEVLASQVLSSGINSEESSIARPLNGTMFSSPFHNNNSYPHAPVSSQPSMESPTRNRRPSSSSTISALSEEDTLEETNV